MSQSPDIPPSEQLFGEGEKEDGKIFLIHGELWCIYASRKPEIQSTGHVSSVKITYVLR